MSLNEIALYNKLLAFANKHCPIMVAKLRFIKLFHRRLDLRHPKDLNEKILYLSLKTDTSEWTKLADKYLVRQFIRDRVGEKYLVKLYGKWDSETEINWDSLPNSFVLKANNGSGTVLIVEDKNKLDIPKTTKLLHHWLTTPFAATTSEHHYDAIKPCIIAEELLVPTEDEQKLSTSVIDYKVWCFDGKPDNFFVGTNRSSTGCEFSYYDLSWNYHPEMSVFSKAHPERKSVLPKPKNIDEMLEVARKLSQGFPVVRVDLYNVDGNIFFGEMTFTSLGGTMTYYTQDALLSMGSKITSIK